jgi:hypothetical protein
VCVFFFFVWSTTTTSMTRILRVRTPRSCASLAKFWHLGRGRGGKKKKKKKKN